MTSRAQLEVAGRIVGATWRWGFRATQLILVWAWRHQAIIRDGACVHVTFTLVFTTEGRVDADVRLGRPVEEG